MIDSILVAGGDFLRALCYIQVSRHVWTIRVLDTDQERGMSTAQKDMCPKPFFEFVILYSHASISLVSDQLNNVIYSE